MLPFEKVFSLEQMLQHLFCEGKRRGVTYHIPFLISKYQYVIYLIDELRPQSKSNSFLVTGALYLYRKVHEVSPKEILVPKKVYNNLKTRLNQNKTEQ